MKRLKESQCALPVSDCSTCLPFAAVENLDAPVDQNKKEQKAMLKKSGVLFLVLLLILSLVACGNKTTITPEKAPEDSQEQRPGTSDSPEKSIRAASRRMLPTRSLSCRGKTAISQKAATWYRWGISILLQLIWTQTIIGIAAFERFICLCCPENPWIQTASM